MLLYTDICLQAEIHWSKWSGRHKVLFFSTLVSKHSPKSINLCSTYTPFIHILGIESDSALFGQLLLFFQSTKTRSVNIDLRTLYVLETIRLTLLQNFFSPQKSSQDFSRKHKYQDQIISNVLFQNSNTYINFVAHKCGKIYSKKKTSSQKYKKYQK